MISASELRRRAVRRNVLVKSSLPRTPRVPHNEIALEDQSEVKIEPKSVRYKHNTVRLYNSHLLLVSSPSQLCLWIKFLQF